MKKVISFTDEQVNILAQNPYTHAVSNSRIVFTLEFKKFFAEQMTIPGMTTPKIFQKAGYDLNIMHRSTMDRFRIAVRHELASETGLKPPKGLSTAEKAKAFSSKDLSKQRTDTSIRELQDRVVYLEQQIEFLKKISNLINQQ